MDSECKKSSSWEPTCKFVSTFIKYKNIFRGIFHNSKFMTLCYNKKCHPKKTNNGNLERTLKVPHRDKNTGACSECYTAVSPTALILIRAHRQSAISFTFLLIHNISLPRALINTVWAKLTMISFLWLLIVFTTPGSWRPPGSITLLLLQQFHQ